ncbi:uncharacterized protein LOC116845308 [Odontomachus brunneus]|uniref:uncharacterized protein LOC116845308 n=1 Tax=Odontomachus brunneus TaxID=486640 RepID=UPI0013F196F7|nr:uncharacterized protein LOC116845308 [Odontomachus brunneus]
MLDMMDTLKKFLKERRLELSTEKTKIVVFNRKGRERKEKWKWKDKGIEEVKEFKYLGFTFNQAGNYKAHIRDLYKKGRVALNKVWGLGERICRDDFVRRWALFRYLVQSVMSYGVEVWGWEEKEKLERIMMDYVRWIFRLDFCTPRYIIMYELGMEKLKIGWGIRAKRYEEKIRNSSEERLIKNTDVQGTSRVYPKEVIRTFLHSQDVFRTCLGLIFYDVKELIEDYKIKVLSLT